jgi:Na+/H+ antiporter NhaC
MFKEQMKEAAEAGLLLFIKYALVLGLIYVGVNIFTNITSGASNGTAAAMYLNELQQKGYLPKIENGQIPAKKEEPHAENSK